MGMETMGVDCESSMKVIYFIWAEFIGHNITFRTIYKYLGGFTLPADRCLNCH